MYVQIALPSPVLVKRLVIEARTSNINQYFRVRAKQDSVWRTLTNAITGTEVSHVRCAARAAATCIGCLVMSVYVTIKLSNQSFDY